MCNATLKTSLQKKKYEPQSEHGAQKGSLVLTGSQTFPDKKSPTKFSGLTGAHQKCMGRTLKKEPDKCTNKKK